MLAALKAVLVAAAPAQPVLTETLLAAVMDLHPLLQARL
jgi:hypothetical protein